MKCTQNANTILIALHGTAKPKGIDLKLGKWHKNGTFPRENAERCVAFASSAGHHHGMLAQGTDTSALWAVCAQQKVNLCGASSGPPLGIQNPAHSQRFTDGLE